MKMIIKTDIAPVSRMSENPNTRSSHWRPFAHSISSTETRFLRSASISWRLGISRSIHTRYNTRYKITEKDSK